MVELKDGQQEELDGRLQFHSCLDVDGSGSGFLSGCILESSQLQGSYVGLR